jgi:hypothetical protein
MTASPPPKEKPHRGPGKRFQPGQSGNPAGRPTGARSKAMLALDALAEGEVSEVVRAMLAKAKEGDTSAAALLFARTWPARKGRPTPLPLPIVQSAADVTAARAVVIEALADGTLSAEEAQSVSGVLEDQRRAIETESLERRIAALESAKEGAQ